MNPYMTQRSCSRAHTYTRYTMANAQLSVHRLSWDKAWEITSEDAMSITALAWHPNGNGRPEANDSDCPHIYVLSPLHDATLSSTP